jgi:hypothetical protein
MRSVTRWLLAMVNIRFCLSSLIGLSLLVAQSANAVTGVPGQVGNIETIGPAGGASANYDFRMFLATGEVICNGQNWAYMNTGDANYSGTYSWRRALD